MGNEAVAALIGGMAVGTIFGACIMDRLCSKSYEAALTRANDAFKTNSDFQKLSAASLTRMRRVERAACKLIKDINNLLEFESEPNTKAGLRCAVARMGKILDEKD